MDAAAVVLHAPWHTLPGLLLLYGSFVLHGLLGLYALYRRRHLRLPAGEAWQLALGLMIPLLFIPHAGAIRLGETLHNMDFGYARLLYLFWVASPDYALPRQLLQFLVVWIHGCIGLRAWLRSKVWYGRFSPALTSIAVLVPTIALLGFVNAGLDLREAVQRNAPDIAVLIAAPTAQKIRDSENVNNIVDGLLLSYIALVLAVLMLRAVRDFYDRHLGAIHITYPGGRVVPAPAGFSILEASRWAGIPHTSVCGGRGRCSTCRIRVVGGDSPLPAPSEMEAQTLHRIAAPPNVRLACQLRPAHDIAVVPLVPAKENVSNGAARFEAAVDGGREIDIAAVFVDLRDSTRLAAGRLPYDALFLFDRYVQVVTGAIQSHGGHVTSVAGDGVMSVFEAGGLAMAAHSAVVAAYDVWEGIDALNDELSGELGAPLRPGIGIHVGSAVVGRISTAASPSLQFLGDTGNVAAKLEEQTKHLGCTLVISCQALDRAGLDAVRQEVALVTIAGKADPMQVAVFRKRSQLASMVARSGT